MQRYNWGLNERPVFLCNGHVNSPIWLNGDGNDDEDDDEVLEFHFSSKICLCWEFNSFNLSCFMRGLKGTIRFVSPVKIHKIIEY